MANRYWVGGTGNWDAADTSHWSATSGGAGGASVPTASDDVFFDSSSGAGTATLGAQGNTRNLDCTGYTGTLAQGGYHIYANPTAGGTVKLAAGMTYTSAFGYLVIQSAAGANSTLTTAGKTLYAITFQSATTGGVTLADALTTGAATANIVALASGTLDTNSQAITAGSFQVGGAVAKVLTLGSSAITVTASGSAWSAVASNLTITANTATATMSGVSAAFDGYGYNWNGMTLVMSGSGNAAIWRSGNTFGNLTYTGGANKTGTFTLYGTNTVTGTLTINGNSAVNRVIVGSDVLGTARSVTAAVVSLSNCDFMDITGAGAAAPFTGTSLGDCGGNSGITFTTPATQTHTASAGGNWSDPTKWTSRVPLPQDDVVVDANTSGTLTADMPRLGKSLTFTGFAGTFTPSVAWSLYGSLTLASGMTFTSTAYNRTFCGRSAYTLTSAGKDQGSGYLIVTAPGGSLTFQDAYASTSYIVVTNGGLNTNSQTVACYAYADTGTATRSLTFGTSVVTFSQVSAASNALYVLAGGMTMSAASATFVIGAASSAARTFVGAGFSYGTLRYTVASSPGSLTITGANTFTTLNVGAGRPLILPSSATTTVTNMNAVGVPNGYTYLPGLTGNYLSAPDSAALSITGDIDIRVRVAMDDWSPAVGQIFASKSGPYGQWSWSFYNTNGQLQWWSTTDGMNIVGAWSSAYLSTLDGTAQWVRVTRSASTGDVKFYTSPDGVSPGTWTQLGTTFSAASGAIYDGTAPVAIGAQDNGGAGAYALAGKLYRAQLRNGIDGTVVFDADLTTKQCGARSFVESSASAATVTINGTSARAGDGSINLSASTPGTFATLHHAGVDEIYGLDYLSISDIHATV